MYPIDFPGKVLFVKLIGNRRFHILLLLIVVGIVFSNSLGNGFVWDDNHYMATHFQTFDLSRIFSTKSIIVEYFPLRDVTISLDAVIWGKSPFGFHFTNLLFYALTVVMAYYLITEIELFVADKKKTASPTNSSLTALCTALLFAVHPLHSEAVSWVSCRGAIMTGLFFFLSCFLYLRFMRDDSKIKWLFYAGSVFSFICSLLSKHYGITLPLVCMLFAVYGSREKRRVNLATVVPFFAIASAFYFFFKKIAIKTNILDIGQLPLDSSSLLTKLAKAVQISFFYMTKLVIPTGLTQDYDIVFHTSLLSPSVVAKSVALVAIVIWAFWTRKKHAGLFIGLGWLFLVLLPAMNFFDNKPIVTDRYAFIASFGFLYGAVVFFRDISGGGQLLRATVFSIILVVFGTMSIFQNRVWRSNESLWRDAITKSPEKVDPRYNLGIALLDANRTEEAIEVFENALRLHPGNAKLHGNLGSALLDKGSTDEAIKHLLLAVQKMPAYFNAYYNLGVAYERKGRTDDAIAQFQFALNLVPESAETHNNLGSVLLDKGLTDKAIEHLQYALRLDPNLAIAHYNLGNAYRKYGHGDKSVSEWRNALRLEPNNTLYRDTLNKGLSGQ